MPTELTAPSRPRRSRAGPAAWIALPVLATAVAASCMPAPLVLPAVSVMFLCGGLVTVFRARRAAGEAAIRLRDVAGLLTLFGFFAAMLSEPEQAFPLLRSTGDR